MKNIIKLGLVSLLALPTVAVAQEDDSALRRVSKDIEELQSSTQRVLDLNAQLRELDRREDPADEGVERVRWEDMPYSLPQRIAEYTAERSLRAGEINDLGAQINVILSHIKTHSDGKHDLSAYAAPTGVTPDAAGVAKVEAFVENEAILSLVDRLGEIRRERLPEPDPDPELVTGGGMTLGTFPRGVTIALLCAAAVEKLGPYTADTTLARSIGRFLFADEVVRAAQADALALPTEKAVLQHRLDLERGLQTQESEFHLRMKDISERMNKTAGILEK